MKIGIDSHNRLQLKEDKISVLLDQQSVRCPVTFDQNLKEEFEVYEVLFNQTLKNKIEDESQIFAKCEKCKMSNNDTCIQIKKIFIELIKEYLNN